MRWSGAVLRGIGGMAAPRELLAPQATLADLPALDGSLAYSDAALDLMARDQGGMIRRRPRAILHPGSIDDVVRIVQYANRQRLPVVMRGRAHSRYGQSLTDGGIVIDSRFLAKVRGISNGTIDIEAGADLATLVSEAFAAGFALPVMTDCTMLSVGGFLSVGGQSAREPTLRSLRRSGRRAGRRDRRRQAGDLLGDARTRVVRDDARRPGAMRVDRPGAAEAGAGAGARHASHTQL